MSYQRKWKKKKKKIVIFFFQVKFDIFSRGELVCVCVCLARAALLLLLLIKIPGAILLYRIETRHNRTGFLNLFFFYHLKMHRPAEAYFSSLFFIVLFCLFFFKMWHMTHLLSLMAERRKTRNKWPEGSTRHWKMPNFSIHKSANWIQFE